MNVLSIDHMHIFYFDNKITRLTGVISLYYEPNVLIHEKFNENNILFLIISTELPTVHPCCG
jgi:hypothetical protein